jgi:flagella basal body P-ring formation protein FlgA
MRPATRFVAILLFLAAQADGGARADTWIRAAELRETVRGALTAHLAGGNEETEIVFRAVPDSIAVPSPDYDLRVQLTEPGRLKGVVGIVVDIESVGRTVRRIAMTVVVRTYAGIPVAARILTRHTIPAPEDVRVVRMETTLLQRTVVEHEKLGTLRTKRIVQLGNILFEDLFEPVPLVLQGDHVRVNVRAGNVRLSVDGVAREDGLRGDYIFVRVPGHGDRLRARVDDARTVAVTLE